jgi:hypothetical protein
MGEDDQEALLKALRPLVERYGKAQIKLALAQIKPAKEARGRPKGATQGPKYLDPDRELIEEAYHLFRYGRFSGDPDSVLDSVRTTHDAIQRTVEKFWPGCRMGASTKEAVVRRLYLRFKKTAFPLSTDAAPAPRSHWR